MCYNDVDLIFRDDDSKNVRNGMGQGGGAGVVFLSQRMVEIDSKQFYVTNTQKTIRAIQNHSIK